MKTLYIILYLILILFAGCKKDYLEIKPDKKLVVPATAKDLQALLDNTRVMNTQGDPSLGEQSADDYFLTDNGWETISLLSIRNAYIWAKDIFETEQTSTHWNRPYQMVFYANVVLETADKLPEGKEKEQIIGEALFYRSWAFYNLAQVFCKPYQNGKTNAEPGIPLRLEADINLPAVRATVEENYKQIVSDLLLAATKLPESFALKTRPGQAAVHAMLARVYLQMGKYAEALQAAENALKIQSVLIDYNTVNATLSNPFKVMNEEVIYHSELVHAASFGNSRLNIVPEVYAAYDKNDLRKGVFFVNNNGTLAFKGSYSTLPYFFSGLATNELFLIKAECLARGARDAEALLTLNVLLAKRWNKNFFVPQIPAPGETVLDFVLKERRKELLFRGLRWPDLRRLNMEERYKKDLQRTVKGQLYTLPAGDARYVFPIPPDVILISGMAQNIR